MLYLYTEDRLHQCEDYCHRFLWKKEVPIRRCVETKIFQKFNVKFEYSIHIQNKPAFSKILNRMVILTKYCCFPISHSKRKKRTKDPYVLCLMKK